MFPDRSFPNGFDLPLPIVFAIAIPALLITAALMIYDEVQSKRKRRLPNVWYWVVLAGCIGLVLWAAFLPYYLEKTFRVYFYALMIILGVVAAALLSQSEAKRRGVNADLVWDALLWLLVAGVIGARIWHVFTPTPSILVLHPVTGELVNPYFVPGKTFAEYIWDIINLRNGGLGIPGAIIGGAIALYFYCRAKKISFLTWIDIAAPGVALAQAIGRLGNFFNQEVYGLPTDLPWRIYIDPLHRADGYESYSHFHPLFLYELLWNLLNMFVLLWLGRRFKDWLKPGDILYGYMLFYAIGRFSLEFLRLDSALVGGINFNQWFIAGVGVVAIALFIWNHRRPAALDEGLLEETTQEE
ncbi:MAG: prolipoprotein diacylglyceryl transferase [Anaerolineales bacterium]|nr:prolipoprotein diacylglyceryl transferase [Anaerolineales bacterium]